MKLKHRSVLVNTVLGLLVGAMLLTGAQLTSLLSSSCQAESQDAVVIVNEINSFKGSEKELENVLRQLFLKQRKKWPESSGGESLLAKPFGRKGASKCHKIFVRQILTMTESELAKHWIAVKQKTGQVPPRKISSGEMVRKMVAKYPGAFGVVSRSEVKSMAGVRIIYGLEE